MQVKVSFLRRFVPSKRRVVTYLALFGLLVAFKLLWILVFRVDGAKLLARGERTDLLTRRAYLIERLYREQVGIKGMPANLDELFQGEWALVTYSMAATALVDIALLYPETIEESRRVLASMLEKVLSKEFRRFDTDSWREDSMDTLDRTRGHVGYLGHLNLMLAGYHTLGGNEKYQPLFTRVTRSLEARFEASPFLNVETYPLEIYIPDNAVAIASIAIHERLFGPSGHGVPGRWIDHASQNLLDPVSGLLVFSVDTKGRRAQLSRGSGAAWSIYYLFRVDDRFALEQYSRMKHHLKKRLFGFITGIKEMVSDENWIGDVDSGPVIFGLSPAATGFAVGGARFAGDADLLGGLLWTAELAGFSFQWNGQRRYLLAPLVGDAIMLAMRTATPWKNNK